MKDELNNSYEDLKKVYEDLKKHLTYAENKNNILITSTSIIFVPLFSIFTINDWRIKILLNNLIMIFWIMTIIIGFAILVIFAFSCMPMSNIKYFKEKMIKFNIKKNITFNIFFYKWWINDYDYCKKEITEKYKIEDSLFLNQLLKQIYDYAFIINRKYFYSKLIIWLFCIFILLFCSSFFLLFFY